MKHFFLLCLVLFTLVSCSKQYYRVQDDGVEFHEGSDDKSEVLFTLDEGAVVYGHFEHDGWCQVRNSLMKEQRGWVKKDYLASITEAEADSLKVLAEAKMQEEGEQLSTEKQDRKTGLVFKAAHPNLRYFIMGIAVLGFVLLILLWRQQSKRHFAYLGLIFTFVLSLVVNILAGVYTSTGSGRLFYNLLPLSLGLSIIYPIYYTNISLNGLRWLSYLLIILMLPFCFMLFADHQDGFFWPPLKWWLINAVVFFIYNVVTESNKCPYCGYFANQKDTGERFERVVSRASQSTHTTGGYHQEKSREYEGGHLKKIVTEYVAQRHETTTTSWKVDIFSLHCRCLRCETEYSYGTVERNARDYKTSKKTS